MALLEDDNLAELYIEDNDRKRTVGNIYRGKVINVLPGMQAAFIDIGLDRNAFLYIDDIVGHDNKTIEEILKEGQELTVQVNKEASGSKGARVSTNISLPGKHIVLIPTADYIGVSKKIADAEERKQLKDLANELKPEDMGLIIRTAAKDIRAKTLKRELALLLDLWEDLKNKEQEGKVPRLLYSDESLIYRTFRDHFNNDVEKLIINDFDQYKKILSWTKRLMPKFKNRIYYQETGQELFSQYGIEDKIKQAVRRKVWLKSGAYLIIEPTEALTVIDVNTGKYVGKTDLEDTVLKTNLEAVDQIAAQIRLRDIGGIIIIDFIDMVEEDHRQVVLEALREAVKKDRTKTNIVGFTGLGLVEMTRKKARQRLSASLLKSCPHCGGMGKVFCCPDNDSNDSDIEDY